MPQDRQKRLEAIRSTLVGTGIVQAINVGTGVLIARQLGPSGRGQLSAVLLVVTTVHSIGGLSLSEAITQHVASKGGQLSARGAVTRLAIIQGAMLAAIGYPLYEVIIGNMASASWFLAYIPAALVGQYSLAVLNGEERYREQNLLRVAGAVLSAAWLVAIFARSATVEGALSAYLVSSAVVGAFAWARIRHRSEATPHLPQVFGFAWRTHVGALANLVMERADHLFLLALVPAEQLGLYVVAVSASSPVLLVGLALGPVALARISAVADSDDWSDELARILSVSLAGSVILATIGSLAMPFMLPLVFGESFRGAVTPAIILTWAAVAHAVGSVLANALRGLGHPTLASYGHALGLGVGLVGYGIGIPTLGIEGAAWASLTSYGCAALCLSMVSRHRAPTSIRPTWRTAVTELASTLGVSPDPRIGTD